MMDSSPSQLRSIALRVARLSPRQREQLYTTATPSARAALGELLWPSLARPGQLAPPEPWSTWVVLAGRGYGKTRMGSEFVSSEARAGRARRICLIERTPADARETMIDGDSGLLHVGPPDNRPSWEPARARLVWPNGAIARVFTAAEPDKVRGYESDLIWEEELAAWKAPETHTIARFGLRLGYAKTVITTTPKRSPLLREILAAKGTVITRGKTLENAANLSPAILGLVAQYQGTRLGRQELDAELLDDSDSALWQRPWLEAGRVAEAPPMSRVVVAIDPAVTSAEGSDETGIVAVGRGVDGRAYVLGDVSGRYSPEGWARRAVALLEDLKGNHIVAEANNGGDMVAHTLHTVDPRVRVRLVHASRGKQTRAEPCAAAYEHGDVSHVGVYNELEDQLCSWEPGQDKSPDRLDALVWGWSELFPRTGFSAADAIRAMEMT